VAGLRCRNAAGIAWVRPIRATITPGMATEPLGGIPAPARYHSSRLLEQLLELARRRKSVRRRFGMPWGVWMLRTSRVGVDRFRALRSFDEAEKRSLLKLVRRAEHRLAPYEFWRRRLEIAAVSTIGVFVFASILLSPYLFELLSGRPNGVAGWISAYATAPLAVLVANTLSAAARAAAPYWGFRGVVLTRFALAGAASSAALLLAERNADDGAVIVSTGAASITLAAIIGVTPILVIALGGPMWIVVRAASYFEPDAFALDRLVRVLRRAEGHPAHWTNATFRRDCIFDLELAARCIERDLGRGYGASRELRAWLRGRCRGIGAALRRSAREVALSRAGARERLQRRLHVVVRHAALQQWAELASAAPEPKITRAGAFLTWLLGLVRAALPAAALAVLQQTHYALQGTVEHYATAAVVLWAVTGLVPLVDPHYASKLRGVSGLRSEAEAFVRDRLR
jgi:hypothetical protein